MGMAMSDPEYARLNAQAAFLAFKPSPEVIRAVMAAIKTAKVAAAEPARKRGPNKLTLAAALKQAKKIGAELTIAADGTMKFRPVSTANNDPSEPSDAWDQALGIKQ
jgi:hypothetical protein